MHHVRHLCGSVAENLDRYSENKAWAGKATGHGPVRLSSALEPAIPLELELPHGDDLKDLENAKIVYGAFPNLTPLQARDPRLWTKLAHVDCWAYMRRRWDVASKSDDAGLRQRYVLEHYFVRQNQSRMLLRHGIARLWWYGYLTHDPKRQDAFELTGVLLSYLDIAQQVLERNMGRAQSIRVGFLDFLRENWDELGSSAGLRRRRIRDLAKSLNLLGGVVLLDCLTTSDVRAILSEELAQAAV